MVASRSCSSRRPGDPLTPPAIRHMTKHWAGNPVAPKIHTSRSDGPRAAGRVVKSPGVVGRAARSCVGGALRLARPAQTSEAEKPGWYPGFFGAALSRSYSLDPQERKTCLLQRAFCMMSTPAQPSARTVSGIAESGAFFLDSAGRWRYVSVQEARWRPVTSLAPDSLRTDRRACPPRGQRSHSALFARSPRVVSRVLW